MGIDNARADVHSWLRNGLDRDFSLPDNPMEALAIIGEYLDGLDVREVEQDDLNDCNGRLVPFIQLHALTGLAHEAKRISGLDIEVGFPAGAFLSHKIKTPLNAGLSEAETFGGVAAFLARCGNSVSRAAMTVGKRLFRSFAFNSRHNYSKAPNVRS